MGKLSQIGDLVPPNTVLHDRFLVVRRLGQGGFGQVSAGRDLARKKNVVAIKAEMRFRNSREGDPRRLIIEQNVMIALRGKPHIPLIFASGKTENGNPYIVMSLLGATLSDLRLKRPKYHFTLPTTICASQQILCGLQYLHEVGFIHRDVKPCNTCVGKKDPRTLYIIDFGMCRRIVLPNGQKRPPRKHPHFRGTYRYASLRMHERVECGPADDIQSWLYAMVELCLRELPWAKFEDSYRVLSMKKGTQLSVLCTGMPTPFLESFQYVNQLKWDDTPDYDHIHSLWRSCLDSLVDYTRKFDWELTDGDIDARSKSVSIEKNPQKHQLPKN
ncbi:hypothetical protein M3Y94_01031400 [Aphelenchoides besseyi]|nr:hypothetical protein M3Y94_01031400 [Aphelenchoides besseyi]